MANGIAFHGTSIVRSVLFRVPRIDVNFDITGRFECGVAVGDEAHFTIGVVSSSVSTTSVDVPCCSVEAFEEWS